MPNAPAPALRIFAHDEAERMLPLVRSIVKGMMDDFAERQAALERLDQREADALTEKLGDGARELAGLGVEFKGIELGLVDFPAQQDGELVSLCWQYGEDRIRFWHPLESGYAGRQPLERD